MPARISHVLNRLAACLATGSLLWAGNVFAQTVEPTPVSAQTPESVGAAIYRKSCAECHGKRGEGVAGKYDDPLAGSRSLPSLVRIISKTMPEGKEGTCTGPDADAVAAFIYDAFYSPAAQARIHPVVESLSRLTVAQYQNSVADLLGRFRQGFDRPLGPQRGWRGVYSGFAFTTPEEE
ncbi:MAG: c-type cytochrome, partial [Verrucomicrobiota bacterium]